MTRVVVPGIQRILIGILVGLWALSLVAGCTPAEQESTEEIAAGEQTQSARTVEATQTGQAQGVTSEEAAPEVDETQQEARAPTAQALPATAGRQVAIDSRLAQQELQLARQVSSTGAGAAFQAEQAAEASLAEANRRLAEANLRLEQANQRIAAAAQQVDVRLGAANERMNAAQEQPSTEMDSVRQQVLDTTAIVEGSVRQAAAQNIAQANQNLAQANQNLEAAMARLDTETQPAGATVDTEVTGAMAQVRTNLDTATEQVDTSLQITRQQIVNTERQVVAAEQQVVAAGQQAAAAEQQVAAAQQQVAQVRQVVPIRAQEGGIRGLSTQTGETYEEMVIRPTPVEPREAVTAEGGIEVEEPTPIPESELNAETIRRVMTENRLHFTGCYQQELATNPALQGRMLAHFAIGPGGVVVVTGVGQSDLATPSLEQCVLSRIRESQFPPPQQGVVTVDYPLVFTTSP